MTNTTFKVVNNGTNQSKRTFVRFEGLSDLDITTVATSKGTISDGVWSIGSMAPATEETINIVATPKGGQEQSLLSATVYGSEPDFNKSNNTVEVLFTKDSDDSPPCEVKLDMYDGEGYAKFSIRTSGFEDSYSEEYYDEDSNTTFMYYSVFRRDYSDPENIIGEFVGEPPVGATEWWFYNIAFEVKYQGNSTQPEDFIPDWYNLYVEFTPFDGTGNTFIRMPTDPIRSVRYGNDNFIYLSTHDDMVNFVNEMANGPLCLTVTGRTECPPVITHDMREASFPDNQIEYDLRTVIKFEDGGIANQNTAFIDHLGRFQNVSYTNVAEGRLCFAYTKEDGVLVGEMEYPIEDIEYIFITYPAIVDEFYVGDYYVMLGWDKVKYVNGDNGDNLHIPEIMVNKPEYEGYYLNGNAENAVLQGDDINVNNNSECVFQVSGDFPIVGDGEGSVTVAPDQPVGLLLKSYWV